MRKYILALAIFGFSVISYAAEVAVSEITYISPWPTHVDVMMSAPQVDLKCGRSDLYRIDLVNDPGADAKLSTILAAFMAGKKIGLSINGCILDSAKIVGVRLSKQ